jgi:hypothetical protein
VARPDRGAAARRACVRPVRPARARARPRQRSGRCVARGHGRCPGRAHRSGDADLEAGAALIAAVLRGSPDQDRRRHRHHLAPDHHGGPVDPRRCRPLRPAHPHPGRHRDAGQCRQPRPASPVRRPPATRRGARVGRRHVVGRAGRHPAHSDHRAAVLRAHAAGDLGVRRGDAGQADQPADDVRRSDGARHPAVLRHRLPPRRPVRRRHHRAPRRDPDGVPLCHPGAVAPGTAEDRPGQGPGLRAGTQLRQERRMGWCAGPLRDDPGRTAS